MRNTETELFQNLIETLGKRICLELGEGVCLKGVVKSSNRAQVSTLKTDPGKL